MTKVSSETLSRMVNLEKVDNVTAKENVRNIHFRATNSRTTQPEPLTGVSGVEVGAVFSMEKLLTHSTHHSIIPQPHLKSFVQQSFFAVVEDPTQVPDGYVKVCFVHKNFSRATVKDVVITTPKKSTLVLAPEIFSYVKLPTLPSDVLTNSLTYTLPALLVTQVLEPNMFEKGSVEGTFLGGGGVKFSTRMGHNIFTNHHFLARERTQWVSQFNSVFSNI